ncbi:MAG: carboxylate--amine ligase [Marinobacter sp.]
MNNHTATQLPHAVVMGLSPTGLHVVRELGRHGVPVIGVSAEAQAGSASRFLAGRVIEPDPERRLITLCEMFPVSGFADKGNKPVLIPTSDQDVDLIIENSEWLAQHFGFQESYTDGLASKIMDKESFYEICASQGVEFPKLWKGTVSEIRKLRSELLFPCIIKPSRIHEIKELMKGKKVWMVRNASELDGILDSIPDDSVMLLAQEIVPGPESEIALYCGYFDSGSNAVQPFTARKLRQYPPGFGSASLVQSSDEHECREITEKLLASIGYRGIAASEFKRDPVTGKWKIIEINVRPSLWFSISSAAAKQPVLAAYYKLAGLEVVLPELPQQNGVRWRYLLKDLWSSWFYRANNDFILPPPDINILGDSKKRISAVFSMDDPKPALSELNNFAAKGWQRLRSK